MGYNADERLVIGAHNTPAKVQDYLKSLDYNWESEGPTLNSFRNVVACGTAHCLEGVITAAAILENYGFEPLALDMETGTASDHVVFLYGSDVGYGTIGKSRHKNLHGRCQVYRSVEELLCSYYQAMTENGKSIRSFAVVNLDEIPRANWRFSGRNLWAVEKYLQEVRHYKFNSKKFGLSINSDI